MWWADGAGTESVAPLVIPVQRRLQPAELTVEPLLEPMGVRVAGEINLGTRHVWEAALEPLMKPGADVYLDLGRVVFSDAASVGMLVTGAQRLSAGRRVVLIDPPRSMRRTLELLYAGVSSIEVQGR